MLGLIRSFWSNVMYVTALWSTGSVMGRVILDHRKSGLTDRYVRELADRLRMWSVEKTGDRRYGVDEIGIETHLAGRICAHIADATLQYLIETKPWAIFHSRRPHFQVSSNLNDPRGNAIPRWRPIDPLDHEPIAECSSRHLIATSAALVFARALLSEIMSSCPDMTATILRRSGFHEFGLPGDISFLLHIEFMSNECGVVGSRKAVSKSAHQQLQRIYEIAQKPITRASREARDVQGGCGR